MRRFTILHLMLLLADIASGAIAGGIIAAILLPVCRTARGYFAVGAEWFLIALAAFIGYSVFNTLVFNELLRKR